MGEQVKRVVLVLPFTWGNIVGNKAGNSHATHIHKHWMWTRKHVSHIHIRRSKHLAYKFLSIQNMTCTTGILKHTTRESHISQNMTECGRQNGWSVVW
jgi:hypothetical protein